jgi:tRNA(fMet)-specific endonuclease VapC
MKYLLDTDVLSELAKGHDVKLLQRVQNLGLSECAMSVISEAEIRYGQACRPLHPTLTARIDALLAEIPCLPMGKSAVAPYALIRAELRRLGTPIGPNDFWIAAHALAENLILVTGNDREFARVPGLRVENWLTRIE